LGDCFEAVLFQHLPRDGVNLNFGNHPALPWFKNPHQRNNLFPRGMSFKPMSRRSRSLPSRIMFGASCRARVMSCRCQALSPCGKRDFELQFLMRTNPASFDFWVSHQMGMPNRF
jgi:hypothetical protein